MSKVICEICGTTYQDTADCCPICGCSRDAAAELLGADFVMEETIDADKSKGGRFSSKKKKEIFDFDEANAEEEEVEIEEEDNPYDEEEEYEEGPRHNTFLVILLTVLIAALLIAAGYVFVRYFLPNMDTEETVPSTVMQEVEETAAPTTELSIPCQSLVLKSGGVAEISKEGNYHLINVVVDPADTTDELIFTSADESIATVTDDGRVTAVSEGETVIYITCGQIQLTCNVVCRFVEETEPPTEETTVPEEVEETTAATADPDVVLKLKKTDIMLGVYYQFQLELDCELAPEDVEWSSEHPHIATVDESGLVTAVKSGTTAVHAKYGDQEVQCIVRCG